MSDHYLLIAAFILGVIWLKTRVKKIQPYHIFLLILFGLVNLRTFFPDLPSSKQMGAILIFTAIFGYYDCGYTQKMRSVWRYLLIPLGYGLYLVIV